MCVCRVSVVKNVILTKFWPFFFALISQFCRQKILTRLDDGVLLLQFYCQMPAITCVITVDAERTRARLPKHLLVCRWLSLNGTQKSKYSFWFYFFLLPSSCLLQERFWIVSEIKNLWLFQFWECPAVCVVYDRNWTWLVFVCCGFFHFTYTFVSLLVCSLIHWSCYFVKMIMKSVTLLCYCCWITLLFSSVFAFFFENHQ